MTNDGGSRDRGQMVDRAQKSALGFTDAGLTQAEELLRRVSPAGRAQARRGRAARARRRKRVAVQPALAAFASTIVLVLLAGLGIQGASVIAAATVMVLLSVLILNRAPPATPGREALVGADLRQSPSPASG